MKRVIFTLVLICAASATAAPRAPAPADLVRLGYKPHIAKTIVAELPAVARKIVRLHKQGALVKATKAAKRNGQQPYQPGEPAWAPVTLYRGVRGETVDPRYVSPAQDGLVYTSPALATATFYALRDVPLTIQNHRHGLVMELQLPRFLVRDQYHPVLRTKDVPDQTPFIARVGKIRYTKRHVTLHEKAEETGQWPEAFYAAKARWLSPVKTGDALATFAGE